MEKQIKVAMIPDNTRIIINAGYDDSNEISEGREIEVYIPSIDIIDPDTNKKIGQYGLIKERLELTNVYETYSIARKIKEENKKTGFAYALSSPLLQEKTVYTIQELNVSKKDNLDLKNENREITVGDFVKIL